MKETPPKRYKAAEVILIKDRTCLKSNRVLITGIVYSENGVVGEYIKGVIQGPYRYWNTDGQLVYESNWKEGKREGKLTRWYNDGRLMYETVFKGGTGTDIIYSQNGNILWEMNYKSEIRHGNWCDWDFYSKKKQIMVYNEGVVVDASREDLEQKDYTL